MAADSERERGREAGALIRVGQLDLLANLAKDVAPLTRAQEKLVDAGVEITQAPDEVELAYLARELVQCTLPHSDPGDVPLWTRSNGNVTLVIARLGLDERTLKPIGYPYGSLGYVCPTPRKGLIGYSGRSSSVSCRERSQKSSF